MSLGERMVWVLVIVGGALIATGCAHPLRTATLTVNAAALSLTATHAGLVAHRKAAQEAAARRVRGDRDDPSVRAEQRDRASRVGWKYREAFAAYEAARLLWVSAVAAIRVARETYEATGHVDPAPVAAALQSLALAQQRLCRLANEHNNMLGPGLPEGN